jgi:hypothetical protein
MTKCWCVKVPIVGRRTRMIDDLQGYLHATRYKLER